MASSKWRELFLILLLSCPFIFWGVGATSLLDPDEGMYGAIAREMAEKGDWITPHFDGVRYLEKPPLYFWLTALTISLVGPSEWTVRLWSALPALGTALLIWGLGRLLYGGPSGLLSAIILLTSAGVFRYTRVAATDSLLVFSLTLSLYGFVRIMLSQSSIVNGQWSGPMLFYLGMALGVLSKGLIGVVFPLFIAGLYLWFSGEKITIRQMHLKWGAPFFLALILPWHLLVAWKNPGFLQFYFVDNQFLRFLSDRAFIEDVVSVGSFAFLGLTFVWFFPWSLFLWGTWRHGLLNAGLAATPEDRLHLVVGLWAFTVIGFFFISPSRLEHYILPALPPLSLVVGASWCESLGAVKLPAGLKWPLVASTVGCATVGVALILLAPHLTSEAVFTWLAEINVYYRILKEQGASFPYETAAPFVPLVKGLGIALLLGLPLSLLCFFLGKPRASFVAVMGVASVISVLVVKLLFIIEPHHSAKPVALVLNTLARPEEAIIHEGSLEYSGSLPFYTGRQIYVLNGKRGDLDFGSGYPEGQGVFLDDGEFARRWQNEKRVFLVTRLQEPENAPKRLALKDAFLLGRYGSRLLYSNHGS
jgi:4-amino-4-deoxy-L-arabinose transferase-like glycosyltransferase